MLVCASNEFNLLLTFDMLIFLDRPLGIKIFIHSYMYVKCDVLYISRT